MPIERTRIARADGTVETIERHVPEPRQITPYEFMQRIGAGQRRAVAAAALQSPDILLLLLTMAAATVVDLDDPVTRAGVKALQDARLLTAEEAAAVLA